MVIKIPSLKKYFLGIIVGLQLTFVWAQVSNRGGTLRFTCGLTQAFMNAEAGRPVMADGFAEYYPSDKISIKGSLTQYVVDRKENSILKQYTGFSLGAFYHWGMNQHDFSLGIQPGVALEKINSHDISYEAPTKAISTVMVSASYALFFHKNFHFYTTLTQNISYYRGTPDGSLNTSWTGITGGLGYQFDLKK